MRKFDILALTLLLALQFVATDVLARSEGIVAKPSAFSVEETMNRLEAVFKAKGIRVFARIDHAARARRIERQLAPAEVLIFGTPKIGTPLMQASIVAGIDLPLKALAYQDKGGQVFLVYNHPGYLARRHAIKGKSKLIGAISRILGKLTNQAIRAQ